ncbi:MAG: 50S ribosomal protein L29 [Patescibacteria group bacterium]
MKTIELRKKSSGELRELLRDKRLRREELQVLLRQKKVKNVKELRFVRKDIARILTILKEGRPS